MRSKNILLETIVSSCYEVEDTMAKIINILLSIPKSLYVNIRALGLTQGIRMPIVIDKSVSLKGLYNGCFILPKDARFATVRMGLTSGSYQHGKSQKSNLIFSPGAKICFAGG